MKVVTVKLTEAEVVALDEVVRLGRAKSASHAIRQGLLLYFQKVFLGEGWLLNIEEMREDHKERTSSRSGSALWREVLQQKPQ